jgi:hypothetical protein
MAAPVAAVYSGSKARKGVRHGHCEERKVMLQLIWAKGGLRHGTTELHGASLGGRVVHTLLKHSEMEGEGKE